MGGKPSTCLKKKNESQLILFLESSPSHSRSPGLSFSFLVQVTCNASLLLCPKWLSSARQWLWSSLHSASHYTRLPLETCTWFQGQGPPKRRPNCVAEDWISWEDQWGMQYKECSEGKGRPLKELSKSNLSWANYHEWFASSDPSECQKKSKSFTSTYTLCPFKRFAYLSLVFKVVPSAISVQLTVLPKPRKTKRQKQCQSGRSAVLAVDSHWSKFEALPPKSPACRPLNQQLPSS